MFSIPLVGGHVGWHLKQICLNLDKIKDSKSVYRSALLLNEKAHKTEVKEIAVDSPERILRWDGGREVYWMVNLQTGLYISKDLSSIKHFFAEEAFHLLPDPASTGVLLGIKCPVYALRSELNPISGLIDSKSCVPTYARPQSSLINSHSSQSHRQMMHLKHPQPSSSDQEYVLAVKPEYVEVKGHPAKEAPSVQENLSMVPTLVAQHRSAAMQVSNIPTEYKGCSNHYGEVIYDDKESNFSASFVKSESQDVSQGYRAQYQRSRSLRQAMEADGRLATGMYDTSHTQEKAIMHTFDQGPAADSEIVQTDKGAALAFQYYDRVLKGAPTHKSHDSTREKTLSSGTRTRPSKKKKQRKGPISQTDSKKRRGHGELCESAMRSHKKDRFLTDSPNTDPKKTKTKSRSLSRAKIRKASLPSTATKFHNTVDLDKGLSEAYQIYRKKLFWDRRQSQDESIAAFRRKQYILNAI